VRDKWLNYETLCDLQIGKTGPRNHD